MIHQAINRKLLCEWLGSKDFSLSTLGDGKIPGDVRAEPSIVHRDIKAVKNLLPNLQNVTLCYRKRNKTIQPRSASMTFISVRLALVRVGSVALLFGAFLETSYAYAQNDHGVRNLHLFIALVASYFAVDLFLRSRK